MPQDSQRSPVEWQFGETSADADAWLRTPAELHAYVDFKVHDSPNEQWHRITVVTATWLKRHAAEHSRGGIWPALLIVPDGARSEIEASISSQLQQGWRLAVQNAAPLPAGAKPKLR